MKNESGLFLILLLSLTSFTAFSQDSKRQEAENKIGNKNATSLCSNNEIDLFSCLTESKIASICLAENTSERSVQYRLGTINKTELKYPDSPKNSINKFTLSSTPYPGGGENRIKFSIGKYEYLVYDMTIREGTTEESYPIFQSGVLVRKGGDTLTVLPCTNEDMSIKSQAFEIFDIEEFDRSISTKKQ